MKSEILCCPCQYKSTLKFSNNAYSCDRCSAAGCDENFRVVIGKPVLISNNNTDSVFSSRDVRSYKDRRESPFRRVKKFFVNSSFHTRENVSKLLDEVGPNATVLIIGGGEVGNGLEVLYDKADINLIVTDVYANSTIDFVSDAHYLPIKDGTVDAIIIQAVLEHVVTPHIVVDEIFRVLKSEGLVYSEIPFLQSVHEGCFDFTRYTPLGHRILFKGFSCVTYGPLNGSMVVLAWSLADAILRVTNSKLAAQIVRNICLLPLRLVSHLPHTAHNYDSCSGSYFLGRKTDQVLDVKLMISEYRGLQK